MKDISPFQFFRYLIPGGISILLFYVMSLIKLDCGGRNVPWLPFYLADMGSINGLGAGVLAIIIVSIWGFICNLIYQVFNNTRGIKINHRPFFEKLESHKIVEFKNWDDEDYKSFSAKDLSIYTAWTIFDREYYRLANLTNNGEKPHDLMRHEGLFDYLHGTGIAVIGIIISITVWITNTKSESPQWLWIFGISVVFLMFLIVNYIVLRKLCQTHIEGALYRMYAEQANLISRTGDLPIGDRGGVFISTESHSLFRQTIFVGNQHRRKRIWNRKHS